MPCRVSADPWRTGDMASMLGTPPLDNRMGRMYFYIAAGTAVVTAIGAICGSYGRGLPGFFAVLAAFLYVWPYLLPRGGMRAGR